MSEDEFDAIPDAFASVQGINRARILAEPLMQSEPTPSPPGSKYYGDDEEMMAEFLAVLDAMERRELEDMEVGQVPTPPSPHPGMVEPKCK
ncbi:hypothetical protein K443DRAFT_100330 [Laccaria amethystina LaAM-08-1]|jgi:hypothetical protein|uniref:Uncharacterized protein n=1 Tax=Laccaria amethystina LaAM-08-1 TaxID=1095629 RepID=A0A0C9XFP8_9AGAR|nr:hypothetical protein K443DRAFT_100330 [Laccaria amethystina LaAM-08-1]